MPAMSQYSHHLTDSFPVMLDVSQAKCDGDRVEPIVLKWKVQGIRPQKSYPPAKSVFFGLSPGNPKHLLREINTHDLSRLIVLGKPDGYVTGAGTNVEYSVFRFCTGTPDQLSSPSLVDIQAEEMI